MQATAAGKNAVETLRSLWQLLKEVRSGEKKPTAEEEEVIEQALGEADRAAKVAEAEIAKALGYTLCRCQFPPIVMLTVGQRFVYGRQDVSPVHECSSCGYCDAGGYAYDRIAPPWRKAQPREAKVPRG
jgi:hypothetical protein